MPEIIEALEGCIRILQDMDEEAPDPRCYTIIRALQSCIAELDEIDAHSTAKEFE